MIAIKLQLTLVWQWLLHQQHLHPAGAVAAEPPLLLLL
jgi:hypothetical protein